MKQAAQPPVPASRLLPVVDAERCEGQGACAQVCPHAVFEIGRLAPAQRRGLGWRGRLKSWAHGWLQARVMRPDACAACGQCLRACPERAISLQRREPAPPGPGHNIRHHARHPAD